MNSTVIMIIAGVIGVSLVLGLVLNSFFKKKESSANDFKENALQSNLAIVSDYSDSLTINGQDSSAYKMIKGGSLEKVIALSPGEYVTIGNYSFSSLTNKNYTAKNVKLSLSLKAGYEYTLGTYFDERELADAIAYVELDSGSFPGSTFIACMIERN